MRVKEREKITNEAAGRTMTLVWGPNASSSLLLHEKSDGRYHRCPRLQPSG